MTLGPDEVHVSYQLVDRVSEEEYLAAWAVLPAGERARAARFVFARDRERFVVAHAFLRRVLSKYDEVRPEAWQFVVNAFGKPSLTPGPSAASLSFNLSHADGLIACGVARNDVGIDVESVDRPVRAQEIASRFFSPAEVEGLERCPEDERQGRFFELWTLKEAYVKGLGAGLSHPLNGFSFLFDTSSSIGFELPVQRETASWYFALYTVSDRHRMALAVRRTASITPRVTLWPVNDDAAPSPRLLRESPRSPEVG